ncbi:kinase-like domain-containing protein [Bisporella sp. PMI_857]|nr:kinase-like domain-containing protein [Bisporella sp. PMI_857]
MTSVQENHPPTAPEEVEPSGTKTVTSELENDTKTDGSPKVRFASATEEIEPAQGLDTSAAMQGAAAIDNATVKELTQSLQGTQLAGRRMSCFAFEPISLPASRVPSIEDSSREASRYNTRSDAEKPSPHPSPLVQSMHSPPITPAATRSKDAVEVKDKDSIAPGPLQKVEAEVDPTADTPQIASTGPSPSTTNADESRPGSSGVSTRPTSHSGESTGAQTKHHVFSIGPAIQSSTPVSREVSPGRSGMGSARGTQTPPLPGGDANDPYASHRRKPQSKNVDAIDSRFKFAGLNSKQRLSSTNLPKSSSSLCATDKGDKRASAIFGHKDSRGANDSSTSLNNKHHASMSNLTRFFKKGHKDKRTSSPTPSTKSSSSGKLTQLPFDDTHGLTSKYGKFGKVLGQGAGGSVRVMKRSDGKVFAVKEFRARHTYETEKEYAKKVTAEFCVGSALHHGNIIETLDIVHEKDRWYEVMEYAPYDLFASTMTGRMTKEEVTCSWLQIVSGVAFLHNSGLAHRDLKLDNVVVNEHGIMKIIDFGSATVFRYPFESGIVLAHGIVGSDPYLAPEVYDERKYDPQPTDIWSLAIIFCCMSLKRFPWKMPRQSDNSFKLFSSPPTPWTVANLPTAPGAKRLSDTESTLSTVPDTKTTPSAKEIGGSTKPKDDTGSTNGSAEPEKKQQEVIKGPWRLLRMLPRESRQIIGRMLELDPKKRASMEEVMNDPWIANTDICKQDINLPGASGVYHAPGHTHTLEPPAQSTPAQSKG